MTENEMRQGVNLIFIVIPAKAGIQRLLASQELDDSPHPRLGLRPSIAVRSGILPSQSGLRRNDEGSEANAP
jgi:hypothetical protein